MAQRAAVFEDRARPGLPCGLVVALPLFVGWLTREGDVAPRAVGIGMALMRALKLSVNSDIYAAEALKHGLIINSTQGDVLRIMPALTVKPKEIEKAAAILDLVFSTLQGQDLRLNKAQSKA